MILREHAIKYKRQSDSAGTAGRCNTENRGVVLMLTLVLLVVLATLGYTVTSRVMARRHRDQYIIDYQNARYGCDSAVKYALATLEQIDTQLIARPNEPDFSDLFSLTDEQYNQLLTDWDLLGEQENAKEAADIERLFDVNDINSAPTAEGKPGQEEPIIRGPYGPAWPLVAKPMEFEIASAKVKIEIEDENAKYPICWALLQDKKYKDDAQAGLEVFCRWMQLDDIRIDSLKDQLEQINEFKTFKLDFKPVTKTEKVTRRTRRAGSTRTRTRTQTIRTTVAKASVHTSDFARLLHSSLLDTEMLARPVIITSQRSESPLKYIGLFGSKKVNVNTAPRHVLEAAFCFGGDQVEIAEIIIEQRSEQPFENINDLKKKLFKYTASIQKCENFITTTSVFFTIKITVRCGVAESSAVIAIIKSGKKVERIAVLTG